MVRDTTPDVVLMDIRMPEMDGLATLREITGDKALASVRVVMLTTFGLDEYVFAALRDGASGFILKDADLEELLRAVRVVALGESLLSPGVTRSVISQFTRRVPGMIAHPDVKNLTAREREVVTWVVAGLSNDEIATQLVVSAQTVRTHVSRAMLKLQARDRAQLAVFAVRSGLGPRRGEAIHRRYEELLPARGSRQRKPGTTSSARVPPCQLLTNQGTTA